MIKLNKELTNNNIQGGIDMFNIQNIIENNNVAALMQVYEGKTEAKSLSGDFIIEGDKIINKQKTFVVLSYAAGSQVGVTTKGANLGSALYTNPEQFFTDSKLDVKKLRKVLKYACIDKTAMGSGYKYQTVFVDGVNKDIVIDRFNRTTVMCRVSSHEIKACSERIKQMDPLLITIEDLKTIALDLDPIFRALQELSIDVAKDSSKDIGINIHSIINCKSDSISDAIKKGVVENNSVEGITRMLINNKLDNFNYEMKSESVCTLANINSSNKTDLSNAIVEDCVGDIQNSLNQGLNRAINEAFNMLSTCNGYKYNQYKQYIQLAKLAKNEEELKYNHMIKSCIIAFDTYTTIYAAKIEGHNVTSAYLNEVAKQIRNALYTEGKKVGLIPQEVVRCAIAASFCYINNNRIFESDYARFFAVKSIFSKEFALEYIADGKIDPKNALTTELKLRSTAVDLYVDDTLEFTNGIAIVDGGIVKLVDSYTGTAIVTEEGIIADVDYYAYEEISYNIISEVCVDNKSDLSGNVVIPEIAIETENRYNVNMTELCHKAKGFAISNGYMMIKNNDNTVTVVGTILSSNKTNMSKTTTIGAITKQGGFICFA